MSVKRITFSKMTTSSYFIKVIYNHLDLTQDYKLQSQEHDNIIETIDDINDNVKVKQAFNRLDELYTKPSDILQTKFIFVRYDNR